MPLSLAGVRWKKWRSLTGLTQATAAVRLKIDPWYLAKIEQGRRKPGRVLAVKIRDLSGVGIEEWDMPAVDEEDDEEDEEATAIGRG